MTTTITFAALLPFVRDEDVWFFNNMSRTDRDPDNSTRADLIPQDLMGCFGEVGTKGIEAFAAAGVVINEGAQTITFTTEGLKAAAMIPFRVMMDYDAEDNVGSGSWTEFGLSGDDDCDYWGGYLTPIIDALYDYAQANGIPVLPVSTKDYDALLKQ